MGLILNKFKTGDTISFEVHASAILLQDYDNVKVMGEIPAELCDRFGFDAYATHAQIYRLVPEGTMEDDPESYSYLLLKTVNGQFRVIGLPWINTSTIRVHKATRAIFTVDNIAQEDINVIRDAIARHGYHVNLSIE